MVLRGVTWSMLGILLVVWFCGVLALPTPEEFTTELPPPEETEPLITTEPTDLLQNIPETNEVYPFYDEQDDSPLDVNGTIEEVEKILESNPNLPRLSRSEILEILDNLTASQDDSIKDELSRLHDTDQSFPSQYKSREEYARALMLVLPFNAKDMSESKIQELYTKPPVTRIVDKPEDDVILTGYPSPYKYSPTETVIDDDEEVDEHEYYPQEITKPLYEIPSTNPTTKIPSTSNYQTVPKVTKTPVTKQPTTQKLPERTGAYPVSKVHKPAIKPSKEPTQLQSTLYLANKVPEPAQTTVSSAYPTPKPTTGSEYYQDFVYPSTKPVEVSGNYHETQYPVSNPPKASALPYPIPKPPAEQSQDSTYSANKLPKPTNRPSNNHVVRHRIRRPIRPGVTYKSTTRPTTTTTTTQETHPSDIQLGLPQDMKHLLVSFDVQDHISPPYTSQPMLFMTPVPEVTEKIRYSSQYSANRVTSPSTTEGAVGMSENVQEVLASIGLYPDHMTPEASYNAPVTVKMTTTTTTTQPPMLDLSQGAESLSADMKQLLISFGLLPSPDGDSTVHNPSPSPIPISRAQAASPVIDPSSYLSFKPLPLSAAPSGGDMQEFLASFGLVPAADTGREPSHSFRSQKSLQASPSQDNMPKDKPIKTVPSFSTDMLTDEMREVLENIGILPTSKSKKNPSISEETNGKEHVFNPSQHFASLNHSEDDAKRLNKLLETIKKFAKKNATLTPEQMAALDASLYLPLPPDTTTNTTTASPTFLPKKTQTKVVPLDQIQDAPDPLAIEELLQLYNTNKNEIKRQQPNDTSSSNATTNSTEQRVPSFDALAESFGGGETASTDVNVDEQLPPARPNGLYFLLDWNSFMEVGEEGKNKVNIRIAPKIGDRRNFLQVTVP